MIEIDILYTDPDTGSRVSVAVRIFEDQLQHFLEFAEELNEQTQGY